MGKPTTYYNGACPVCRPEVERYRRAAEAAGLDLAWCDISRAPEALDALGLDVEAVKYRLHTVDREGVLRVGVPAFVAIWRELPGFRRLSRIAALPVLRHLLAGLYEVLAFGLYRWNKVREGRTRKLCRPV